MRYIILLALFQYALAAPGFALQHQLLQKWPMVKAKLKNQYSNRGAVIKFKLDKSLDVARLNITNKNPGTERAPFFPLERALIMFHTMHQDLNSQCRTRMNIDEQIRFGMKHNPDSHHLYPETLIQVGSCKEKVIFQRYEYTRDDYTGTNVLRLEPYDKPPKVDRLPEDIDIDDGIPREQTESERLRARIVKVGGSFIQFIGAKAIVEVLGYKAPRGGSRYEVLIEIRTKETEQLYQAVEKKREEKEAKNRSDAQKKRDMEDEEEKLLAIREKMMDLLSSAEMAALAQLLHSSLDGDYTLWISLYQCYALRMETCDDGIIPGVVLMRQTTMKNWDNMVTQESWKDSRRYATYSPTYKS